MKIVSAESVVVGNIIELPHDMPIPAKMVKRAKNRPPLFKVLQKAQHGLMVELHTKPEGEESPLVFRLALFVRVSVLSDAEAQQVWDLF